MQQSLLSPPELEATNDRYSDETPPNLWQRLLQIGNREVFSSLSGVLAFLCLILAFQVVAGILAVYASVSGVLQDPPDPTVSTQYADNCVKALTETLAKERNPHQTR